MDNRLDPLGDLEVKRVLAFARAREQYPSVPRGLLLDYCQAAWQAAVAGGDEHDLVGRFERALMLVAWTHRRSPHLNFRQLVDQVIPQVALRPFMAPAESAPVEELEPAAEPEPSVKRDAVRPPARQLIPRVPFASPVPLGAAVAAGFIGVTMLGQTGALPVAPFAPAGNDDASSAGDGGHHDGAPAASPSTPSGGSASAPAPALRAPIGVAQAPAAAAAVKAPAGRAAPAAAEARSAPAKPAAVSAPAPAPPAPAPAPAVAPAPPVEQVVNQVPAETQVPSEVPQAGDWVREQAQVQAPAEPPAPVDPVEAPKNEVAPTAGTEGNERDAHRFGHADPPKPDHFQPIDLGKAPAAPEAPTDTGAQAPSPVPATTQTGSEATPPAPPAPVQPQPPAPPPPAPAEVGTPPAPPTAPG